MDLVSENRFQSTPDQRRVIESSSRWIAVQAQPGSGKTHVLVGRLIHLLSNGGRGEIIAITFTEKAAEEIKSRVEKSLNRSVSKLWISTIHGFCLRILKEYSWISGFLNSFSILSAEEKIFFQQKAMLSAWKSQACQNLLAFYEPHQCQSILNDFLRFRVQLGLFAPSLDPSGVYRDLKMACEEVFSQYEQLKKEHHQRRGLDFDDLLIYCLQLLRKEPQVRMELRRRFSAILVDEFQDTDEIQKEIIDLLTRDEEDSPRPSLMIVGDPNQSIYRFRGANVDLFRGLKEDIVTRGGFSFDLVQNFRSTERVIEFINGLFEPLLGRDYVRSVPVSEREGGGIPRSTPHTPPSLENETGVEYWTLGADKEGTERRRREATWLATYVNSFRKDAQNIAILLRGMTYSHIYEEALTAANVPWVKSSATCFYEEPEVGEFMALLKWICNPVDDYSLWVILSSSWGGLSSHLLNILMIARAKNRREPMEALLNSQQLRQISLQLEKMRSLKSHLSLMEWYLQAGFTMTPIFVRFLEIVYQFEEKYSRGVGEALWEDFLMYMEILRKEGAKTASEELSGDGVRIMTVHQAKGLEFDVVFLPDLAYLPTGETPWLFVDKELGIGVKIPSDKPFEWKGDAVYQRIQEAEKQEQIEESKRILYVAMTRARRWLILSNSSAKPRKQSWAYWIEENKGRLQPYMRERQFE